MSSRATKVNKTLYRGIGSDKKLSVGSKYVSDLYDSWTEDIEVALEFAHYADSYAGIAILRVDPGQGLYGVRLSGIPLMYGEQGEWLLDGTYRISAIDGAFRQVMVYQVERT